MDKKLMERIVRTRRDVHRHPELGYHEARTSALIKTELGRLGITPEAVARTGVIGRLGDKGKGVPTIALRADIDALPIEEATGLAFASSSKGVMHACGHDGHIAILLGAAALLIKNPARCRTVLMFQPAEENEGGAQALIRGGAMSGVDMVFGGHIDTHLSTGVIALKKGIVSAYTDALHISVKGRGGHAARPHEAADAVYAASSLVVALQGVISRWADPLEPAVLTVGSLHAGTAHNVIAEEASLEGTLRTTDASTRRALLKKIKDTVRAVAGLHSVKAEVKVIEGYPPTVNSEDGFEIALDTARAMLGPRNVRILTHPSMGGEDFAYYLHEAPGCFVRIGAAKAGAGLLLAHSPAFDFDEDALRIGAEYYASLVHAAAGRLSQ